MAVNRMKPVYMSHETVITVILQLLFNEFGRLPLTGVSPHCVQIFWVFGVVCQRRVIAKTEDMRYVSIPLNYSLNFQKLTRKTEKRKICILLILLFKKQCESMSVNMCVL